MQSNQARRPALQGVGAVGWRPLRFAYLQNPAHRPAPRPLHRNAHQSAALYLQRLRLAASPRRWSVQLARRTYEAQHDSSRHT
jgi:hypothetical protein